MGSKTECNADICNIISTLVPSRSGFTVNTSKVVNITGVDNNKEATNTYNSFHVAVCVKTTGIPENARI